MRNAHLSARAAHLYAWQVAWAAREVVRLADLENVSIESALAPAAPTAAEVAAYQAEWEAAIVANQTARAT
eukprot:COSAG06_NODE_67152_length_252_cov_1.352941_1_plen_70_part_01